MIRAENLKKSFGEFEILHGISLEIPDKSLVSITGRSGSGKSTLLYALSSLDRPSSGEVVIDGESLYAKSSEDLHRFRNLSMGFVFQFHYLLPELTALENILMPARKTRREGELKAKAMQLLKKFDLEGKENKSPRSLSGGEQQRVAIARALIMDPKYIFADEPTGNLDSVNGSIVMRILKDITRETDCTVLFVTHDRDYAASADLRINLVDGRVATEI